MMDLGKVLPGSTLNLPFGTYDGGTGISLVASEYATSEIEIYKDGSATARASDAGQTATITFNSMTGIHMAVIDLSENTTAGFYENGSEYLVIVGPITVDGQATVNFPLARFKIGYDGAFLDTHIDSITDQDTFVIAVAGAPAENDALKGCIAYIKDITSLSQGFAVVTGYTAASRTVQLLAGPVNTLAATDGISFFPPVNAEFAGQVAYTATRGLAGTALPAAAADGAGGIPISDDGGLDIDEVSVILADTNELQAKFVGITLVNEWLGALAGKQNADATALTEIKATGAASGTYDPNTDALEALQELVTALENISAAGVNAEMLDVMDVDTLTELTDAVPAATPSHRAAQMALYMDWRNKVTQTATLRTLFNDANAAIIKWTVSDDATTATKAEAVAQT